MIGETTQNSVIFETVKNDYGLTPSQIINPIGRFAMVTSPHYLASQAGLRVLKAGGNAIDAAIAIASTLNVVYPHMTSLGGDNFWLIYNAKDKKVYSLNASGRSGEKATISFYNSRGFSQIPTRGYLAALTVPGIVSGWDQAYQFGQKNMRRALSWSSLFDDAILYAEKGFPVTASLARWSALNTTHAKNKKDSLARFDEFKHTFLKEDGSPYKLGELMRLQNLANTYKTLAKDGARAFYEGEIADKIIKDLSSNDGVLTKNDLREHQANWVDPVSVNYRGYTAYNVAPNSQGFAACSILNILNQMDVASLKEGSADYYHVLIEAIKLAYLDRDRYLSDPDFCDIPLKTILSKEQGIEYAKRISFEKTQNYSITMTPKGDTVWVGVVDQDGNAVSLIQSIYHDFGSAIVPKGTGFLLQNRGAYFSLDKNHVNCLEPKKRTFHTLCAGLLLKQNDLSLVYGSMGGDGQPQTQSMIVTRVVDFNLLPQAVLYAPRFLYGRTWGELTNALYIESRAGENTINILKNKGHDVQMLAPFSDTFGHAGAIYIDPKTHFLYGANDPRSEGLALGY